MFNGEQFCLQSLASAIHQSNTMIAAQVVRTPSGEEHLIELHKATSDDKENSALPAYLSDEESPVKVGLTVAHYCCALSAALCLLSYY